MYKRKDVLVIEGVYHIFTKSIAGFEIFNNNSEYSRMMEAIRYYQMKKTEVKFSQYIKLKNKADDNLLDKNKLVEIIAYCLMPTHLHLILKQVREGGISIFMSNILNSHTRYFNIKHNRKGPLWESRFKSILVETDEQLLHLTRYIHLNPVTSYLVNSPEEWPASSYLEYSLKVKDGDRICNYHDMLDIKPHSYRKFVAGGASYQRELAMIKKLFLE
jgi:putative transposase